MKRARAGGLQALRHRPSPGAPHRQAGEQLARLPALLRRGPQAYGFRGQVWTRKRVVEVMRVVFGVVYHPTPVGRLLNALRWSPQKPVRRAQQHDEAALTRWRAETWPAITKELRRSSRRSSS
jgi:transposase